LKTVKEEHGGVTGEFRGCKHSTRTLVVIPKPKALVQQLGLYTPYIHRNCACNERVALHNRVLSPVVEPAEEWIKMLRPLAKRMGIAARGKINRLSWAGFVSGYKGPKLRRYTRALEKLSKTGWMDKYAQAELFVKPDSADPDLKGSYDPRAIQGRHPCYNIMLGAYLKPFEEWFIHVDNWNELLGEAPGGYMNWSVPSGRLVAKGLSMKQRGRLIEDKWQRLRNPVGFDCDASRFDMHVHLLMLMMEHLVYITAFAGNEELSFLLRKQRRNFGRSFGGWKYKTVGKRMSGDINTGLGNTLIMLFIFIFYTAWLNSQPSKDGCVFVCGGWMSWNGKWDFICDGDDSVFFTEAENVAVFQATFSQFAANLGFKMTVGSPVFEIEHVNFCQSNPVWVNGGYTLVRNPRKALSGALCAKRNLRSDKEARNLLWAVGKCELALGEGVPVMQAFASACIRNGHPHKSLDYIRFELSYRYWHLDANVAPKPVSAATRVSYERAFGVTIADQLYLEAVLNSWTIPELSVSQMFEPIDAGSGQILMDERAAFFNF
jgi:hypothetical protein